MHLIRATCLSEFRELVAELGVDPDPILIRAGLTPQDAGRDDRFISLRGAVDAIEFAAEVTEVRDFGRRLAARRGIETIGPVGIAAQSAATLDAAFVVFSRFIGAHSPGVRVRLVPSATGVETFFELVIGLDPAPRQRQAVEVGLGASLQIVRALLGPGYAPLAVHLPHAALTPPADYVRYFGCAVHFAQPTAGFLLRAVDLERRLAHDRSAHADAVAVLAEMVAGSAPSMAETVTDLARALLPTGVLTIEQVAGQLHLHRRALQRRLASEGTSFGAITDNLRRDTAQRYLRDTDVGLDHLTRLLGYSEQSVLARSCQRWFGCPPSGYRARLQENAIEAGGALACEV